MLSSLFGSRLRMVMTVRCVAWLLVFAIVGVSLDSLPDLPALKSHTDNQIFSVFRNMHMRQEVTRCLWVSTHMSSATMLVEFPSGKISTVSVLPPLILVHHSSDSSPPVPSQT